MNVRNPLLSRRDLLATAATASAVSSLLSPPARSHPPQAEAPPATASSPRRTIVDTNVSLFQWPFRRLPLDNAAALVKKLRALGIVQAWAGSFEAMLHRDLAGVNQRVVETCEQYPELLPIGSINPELPDWKRDLDRCINDYRTLGIRLYPNYHGYTLRDLRFTELLERATTAKRFVQITVTMEDTRTQHPLVCVEDVDLAPLAQQMQSVPGAQVQLLGARPRSPLLASLAKIPGISFDTSRVDGTDGIAHWLQTISADRLMFGTHAPFLIPEASLIRVYESNLDEAGLCGLLSENAIRLSRHTDS